MIGQETVNLITKTQYDHHRSIHPPLDVIMVTYNSPEMCGMAIKSLLATWSSYPFHLFIVNNGDKIAVPPVATPEVVTVLHQDKNLGWEGGLKAGLEHSTSPFVVFVNDDIQIPYSSRFWSRNVMELFRDPVVGAVGPTSNFVSGLQNISQQTGFQVVPVSYLIGFFLALRRDALDKAGGVDTTLPGGDDIDLSIRLRLAGYKLLIRNDIFIFHHGEHTGKREHGDHWNSENQIETTQNALIRRHGLKQWFHTVYKQEEILESSLFYQDIPETEAIASWVPDETHRVLELGCGGQLTVPWSIGVDQVGGGDLTAWRATSKAQVMADVFRPMPMFESNSVDCIIARHILEHGVDLVCILQEWNRILKPGGRLIVASPNEEIADGIPMDSTHLHGLTPGSVRSLVELVGYKQIGYTPNCGNNISFVGVYEKVEA